MIVLVRLKVAVVPVKLAVEITVPLSRRDMDVIPAAEGPVETLRLVMVTTLALGLVSWTCCIRTLEAPATWEELAGGFGPWEASTVTIVGVGVVVIVEVVLEVSVFVRL